jgi:hypothetical protein
MHACDFDFIMALCCSIRGRILEEEGAYVMSYGCGSLLSHSLIGDVWDECGKREKRRGKCPRGRSQGRFLPTALVSVSSSLISLIHDS